MIIENFCADLAEELAAATNPEDRMAVAAARISCYFQVRPHEIGLFGVDHAQHQIHFRWPAIMTEANRIPLKAFNSLVARTANERSSFIDNRFALSRHLFMFEHLLVDKPERIPVQKVISVPITGDEAVRGVIQVVRKGADPEEAGPDFTATDVKDLEKVAEILATIEL